MKKIGVLLLILLVPFVFADENWFLTVNQSFLTTNVSFDLLLQKEAYQFRIPVLSFNTTLYPKDNYRQNVISQLINLDKNISGNNYNYEWELPQNNKTVNINSYLNIRSVKPHIKHKIKYPISNFDEKYIKPTQLINSQDPKIRELATSLAEGDDDLFDIVFTLGVWINKNINYVIDNETINSTQSAAWVLENRKGVCDEMAGLYIAMCRSLNIPARYVGGMAYSNNMEWKNHAWIEVYFPTIGWVPFDAVYGEFGYLDISHIQFYTSLDSNTKSTELYYKSTGAKVVLSNPKIKVELKKSKGKPAKNTEISLTPFKDTIGFNSYNYLDIKIHNMRNYYIAETLILDKTEGIVFVTPKKNFVLLAPNQTKHVYVMFKNNLTFTDRYSYEHPIVVRTANGYSEKTVVSTKPNYHQFNYNTIHDYVKLKMEETKVNSRKIVQAIDLKCIPKPAFTYVGYKFKLPCNVNNNGNIKLEYLRLCLGTNCQGFHLNIGEKKEIDFNTSFNESGAQSLITELTGKNITKSYFNSIMVYPNPKLEITNLNYTKNVTYKDKFYLQFEVINLNQAPVKNLIVKLKHPYLGSSWKIKNFKSKWVIKVNGRGKDLLVGKNNFSISLNYQDLFENNLTSKKSVNVYLKEMNIIQRIPLMVRDFLKWLDHLF